MTGVFSWLANIFGLLNVAMWLISFFSTIPERLLLFFLCSIVLGSSFFFTRFFRSSLIQSLLPVSTSLALFTGLYMAFPFHGDIFPGKHAVAVMLFLTLIVAIDRWRLWLRGDNEEAKKTGRCIAGWLPTVVTVSALAVLLLNGWSLRSLARTLHADQAVQQFAIGDFNGIGLDPEHSLLFATGHGTNYLLAFDVNALDRAPRKCQVEVGWAQAFAYNPRDRELYVYNSYTKTLLYLDATTLALKKTVPALNVNLDDSNDSWIVWDINKDHIIIASEDQDSRSPTLAVNRTTGEVVYSLELAAMEVFLHPKAPLFYMGFYDNLLAYDTELRKFVASFHPGKRFLQRMDMTPDLRELLIAVPVNSAIWRVDPETLEFKGAIATVLGVRTLAIDPVRNLLLTGSLISNMLEVIDLQTKTRVAKYYVGPWLRTISLDTKAGIAYVSSIEGLFKVDYAIPKANWIRRVASRENHRAAPEVWDPAELTLSQQGGQ